jgi:hypothetical protein
MVTSPPDNEPRKDSCAAALCQEANTTMMSNLVQRNNSYLGGDEVLDR